MKVFQCNKCDFKSPNEDDFTELDIYLPFNKKKKKSTKLMDKFDQKEKDLDEADFVNAGLKEKDDPDYKYPVEIHLCPKHTVWFSNLFLPIKKRAKRKKI